MSSIEIFCDFWACALYTSIFIILFYYIRKKLMKLSFLSISSLCFIYLLCLLRLLMPFEAPWAICIGNTIFNPIIDILFFAEYHIGNITFYGHQFVLSAYAATSIVLLLKMLISYLNAARIITKYPLSSVDKIYDILNKVQSEHQSSAKIKLFELEGINSPISFGIFKNAIVLPTNASRLYSENELYYVIKHEFNHLASHDCLLKLLSNIAVCVFFWNPCVYIFRKDLEQSLELRCDRNTINGVFESDRIRYLETMLKVLKNQETPKAFASTVVPVYALNLVSNHPVNIKERFIAISKGNTHRSIGKEVSFCIVMTVLFVASYSVFFGAQYDPPAEDIAPNSTYHEVNPLTDTLVIDGSQYYIIFKDGSMVSVNDKNVINIWESEGGLILKK